MEVSQGSSHCEGNLYRENEGLLHGANKKRENLALFRYQEGAVTLENETEGRLK